ncbi:MAG TPA: class I SAM-dependent methyltransferase [Candidatus Acidoferrales bacterium]|nr:class I SAM-dependent methyltransferase [Candidatus Acidoferrales bacterium]
MEKIPRWPVAQKGEKELWDGIVQEDHAILGFIIENSVRAARLRECLDRRPERSLEVGIGPLGIGVSGFLPEIPYRFGVDPLPALLLDIPEDSPKKCSKEIHGYVSQMRKAIPYVMACGEEIPIRSESMDLIICCNVIDHASQPDAILREIYRILKPDGLFFFDVDTFSMLGLVKWYSWTRHAHSDDFLVTTHPYRMYEADVVRRLRSCGFQIRKVYGHTRMGNLIGHALKSAYVGRKCSP